MNTITNEVRVFEHVRTFGIDAAATTSSNLHRRIWKQATWHRTFFSFFRIHHNETTRKLDLFIGNLDAGSSYMASVTPANKKGKGKSTFVIVDTLSHPAVELTQAEEGARSNDGDVSDGSGGAHEDWDILTGALVGTLGCLSLLVVASLVVRFCVCPAHRRHRGGGGGRGGAGGGQGDGGRIRKVELPSPLPIEDDDDDGDLGGGSLSDPFGVGVAATGGIEGDGDVSLGLLEGVPRAPASAATGGVGGGSMVRKGILKHPAGMADGMMIPPPPFPGKDTKCILENRA